MRYLALVVGGAMFLGGALFTFQGLGYVTGSPMTGSQFWAGVGPLIAGLGLALVIVSVQRLRR